AEELAHGASREGRDVLERRRIRGPRDNDRGVFHGAVLLERRDDLGNARFLLSDRDVDAEEVEPLLVDDRVDRDRALAGLTIADDQLALSATDREHRIDRLDARLHR